MSTTTAASNDKRLCRESYGGWLNLKRVDKQDCHARVPMM